MFNIDDVPQACLNLWKDLYNQYRSEMAAALQHGGETKDECAAEVIKKYKQVIYTNHESETPGMCLILLTRPSALQMLYNAAEFEESSRNLGDIFNEALAIYHVTYDYACYRKEVSFCNFAWRVAGQALCRLYAMKLGEKSMVCLPSVLRDIFK